MFLLSVLIATIYLIISTIINTHWLHEISAVFGSLFAHYIIIFFALIPGFIFIFIVSSLILNRRKGREKLDNYPSVIVLIPTYNACETLKSCNQSVIGTINSIVKQKYDGDIVIKVIDDGSSDYTVKYLKNSKMFSYIDEIIVAEHKGKFNALNIGLTTVDTEYVITVDNDTILHENAINNIINEIHYSNHGAVAGCLFVKNSEENYITKVQQWDYTIGIFGIKLIQSFYNSVLVTQGAFSVYRTDLLRLCDGWSDNIGEDIILTWKMLEYGYTTGFAEDAIAFTDVPETFKKLGIQRKRWARGMIEAFKEVKHIFFSKASIKSKFLVFLNIFFPFIDIAILMFLPLRNYSINIRK